MARPRSGSQHRYTGRVDHDRGREPTLRVRVPRNDGAASGDERRRVAQDREQRYAPETSRRSKNILRRTSLGKDGHASTPGSHGPPIFFRNTVEEYLIAAAVFLGVLVGLPIGKAIILRRLKAVSERTANDFDDLLHDLLRRIVGPFVYLFTALYVGTLFLTLPEGLGGLLQALFVIILTVKVAQVLQGITGYGIRKWTKQTAKADPTSAAMLKNMTWVARFMIWAATLLFVFDNLGSISRRSWRASASVAWRSPWPPNRYWGTRLARSRSSWTSRFRWGTSSLWATSSAPWSMWDSRLPASSASAASS